MMTGKEGDREGMRTVGQDKEKEGKGRKGPEAEYLQLIFSSPFHPTLNP